MKSDDGWYEKRPPLEVGQKYGKLTVTEIGPKKGRCVCTCDCGATVTRDIVTMRASTANAAIPQCKKCMRAYRKQKNPQGGVPMGLQFYGSKFS